MATGERSRASMKICVVGGTGHISTPLVQVLVTQGHAVTCFNRGQREPVPAGVRLIKGDRQERQLFERMMRGRVEETCG